MENMKRDLKVTRHIQQTAENIQHVPTSEWNLSVSLLSLAVSRRLTGCSQVSERNMQNFPARKSETSDLCGGMRRL